MYSEDKQDNSSFLDESLWGQEIEIKNFYPYIADGEMCDNIDWSKLEFDDATEYYSKKFNKFPSEIIEILNSCHNSELKKAKLQDAVDEGRNIVKLQKGLFTINFD